MRPRRGEVWLVDLGEPVGHEQAGRRPALVVSADPLNLGPGVVIIVMPITSTRRGLPSHIEIEPGESGLDMTSYAKAEDVKSISERRFVSRLGAVDVAVMDAVGRALRFLLEL